MQGEEGLNEPHSQYLTAGVSRRQAFVGFSHRSAGPACRRLSSEFIACFGQDENLIVPCFVSLPDRLWKVGSARDDQSIVVRASKRSGDS